MKICYVCKVEKSLHDFSKKKKNKDGLQTECKECFQKYQKKWYLENSNRHKVNVAIRNKRVYDELKKFICDYKLQNPCANCGFTHPAALQFHHHGNDKYMDVSNMVRNKHSKEAIMKEIKKCTVLCANCHAIHHHGERIILSW